MPQQDEADIQSREQPDDLQIEQVQPDNETQPVEVETAIDTEPHPDEAVQPVEVESAIDTEPQPDEVVQPVEIESLEGELLQYGQPELQEPVGSLSESEPVPEVRRLSRAEREAYDRQRRRFAACGRCGYFVADCLVFVGEEAFHTALLDSSDGWVRLEGDETFRRLLSNAYGVQLDIAYDYFDGSCPECRRRFVFAEQEDGPTRLKIQI